MRNRLSLVLPVSVLAGCVSTSLPPRTSAADFVDENIAGSAQIISAAQYRLHQTGLYAQRPVSPSALQRVRQSTPITAEKHPVTPPPPAMAATGGGHPTLANIRFIGDAPSRTLAAGRATNQSLRAALQQLVPAGWQVTLSEDVAKGFSDKVSWQGGDQWPYVLQRILEQNKLSALVDGGVKRVSIAYMTAGGIAPMRPSVPVAPPVAKPATVAGTAALPKNPFAGGKPAVVADKAKTTPVTATASWRAEVGTTLKETLFRWSATQICATGGNWRVMWDTPIDYRIDAPLVFNGDFNAALRGVFGLYQHAQKPLYAVTNTPQCLVRITDQ